MCSRHKKPCALCRLYSQAKPAGFENMQKNHLSNHFAAFGFAIGGFIGRNIAAA